MKTEEMAVEVRQAETWLHRALQMVMADQDSSGRESLFLEVARRCIGIAHSGLAELRDEVVEPAPLAIADEVRRYVVAITNTVRFDCNHPEAGRQAECCFYLAGPGAERDVMGVGSAASEAGAILAAFVDLLNNYALQDGKLVRREEGDDDGE